MDHRPNPLRTSTMTPEARAEKRFPRCRSTGNETTDTFMNTARVYERSGAATIFREQVEPLEAKVIEQSNALADAYDTMMSYREEIDGKSAEVQKLRALVQVLFDALANMKIDIYGPLTTELKAAVIALNAAKEEGFVPTNTEDK